MLAESRFSLRVFARITWARFQRFFRRPRLDRNSTLSRSQRQFSPRIGFCNLTAPSFVFHPLLYSPDLRENRNAAFLCHYSNRFTYASRTSLCRNEANSSLLG